MESNIFITAAKYFLLGSTFTALGLSVTAQNRTPNIVLILADDLGFECIGANGGTSYKTPNIDKLASKGIRFGNYHSQPVCTPTRVQLMTGQYNVRNYLNFGTLCRDQTSFANILKNAGYKTAIAGKWQLGKEKDSPQHFGFENSCLWQQSLDKTDKEGHDNRYSNPVVEFNGEIKRYTNGEYGPDVFSDFLCNFIEENKNKPFLAYYPMALTHCPFMPTPDSKNWNPKDKGSLTYEGDPKYFPDMVAYMDKMVGKIVTKIEKLGLSENTIIIFTGDNGTEQSIVSTINGQHYKGGKGSTKDNGTHTPLIIRWDKVIKAGAENKDLIDCSDFLPTICEAVNVRIPDNLKIDGVSFLPQLTGKEGNPREWIYCWYTKSGKLDVLKELVRNEKYKLYKTGEFYNVMDDFQENKPIAFENLNQNEKELHQKFSNVFKQYENIRKTNK